MPDRALPDLKSRVRLDTTDLDKGSAKAKKFGDDVEQHMGRGSTHTLRMKESITTLVQHMDKLPPVVGQSARSIESLISAGGGAALGLGAFATVMGTGIALAVEGSRKYQELGEQVLNFQRLTGASAEESSRLVQVFGYLGINGDEASRAIYMMNMRLEKSPKAFEAAGIAVATTAKGNVDYTNTLLNIADAYEQAGSQEQKTEILTAAFGRRGREIIPVLEQGREGLEQLEAQVKTLYSQEDLEAIHRYQISQKEAQDSADAFWRNIGQVQLPVSQALTDSFNENLYVNQRLNEARRQGILTGHSSALASRELEGQYRREWEENQRVKEHLDQEVDSQKRAAQAAEEHAKELDDLYNADESVINSGIALERAQQRIQQSSYDVSKAQEELNKATKEYGPNSDQARDAQLRLQDVLLSQKDAYVNLANATVKQAEDQATANGATLDGQQKAQIFRDALTKLEQGLAPDSPLRAALQGYIDQLNSIPAEKATNVHVHVDADSGEAVKIGEVRAFQHGGRPTPHEPAILGERGPELWVPDSAGTVVPHDQLAGMGASYRFDFDMPVVLDGREIGRLVKTVVARGFGTT